MAGPVRYYCLELLMVFWPADPTNLDAFACSVELVIRSRASALLSVVPRALSSDPSIRLASPPDSERFPKLDRTSESEAGERGAKRTASDAPAHSPSAEVGAM